MSKDLFYSLIPETMNDNLLIETKEIGDYRIKIYHDDYSSCPVQDWDMGAIHIFEHLEHGRYWLSQSCDWKEHVSNCREYSVADILQRIAAEVVEQKDIIKYFKAGKVDGLRFFYDRSQRQWVLQGKRGYGLYEGQWLNDLEIDPSDLKKHDYRMELLEPLDEDDLMALIQECAKDFVIKEWNSSGYSQGDHMRGFSYVTKKMFDERCGFSPNHYKTWQEQAMKVIDGEVKCIGVWAWGDVKGYVLEKKEPYTKTYSDGRKVESFDWEEIGSCWGFYMETEELISEVIAEYDLKEAT